MSPDEFRKSLYRQAWSEFVSSPAGQELFTQIIERNVPKQVDPASPVTAWVAAHENLRGAQELAEFLMQLSLPPEQPPEEEKGTFGVPLDQLPDDMK